MWSSNPFAQPSASATSKSLVGGLVQGEVAHGQALVVGEGVGSRVWHAAELGE